MTKCKHKLSMLNLAHLSSARSPVPTGTHMIHTMSGAGNPIPTDTSHYPSCWRIRNKWGAWYLVLVCNLVIRKNGRVYQFGLYGSCHQMMERRLLGQLKTRITDCQVKLSIKHDTMYRRRIIHKQALLNLAHLSSAGNPVPTGTHMIHTYQVPGALSRPTPIVIPSIDALETNWKLGVTCTYL